MSSFNLTSQVELSEEFILRVNGLKKQLEWDKPSSVAVVSNNSFNFLICIISALSSNIKLVLLPNYEQGTIENYKNNSNLVLDDNYLELSASQSDVGNGLDILIPKNSVVTFYTSGSSGDSLAVNKTFQNLLNEVEVLDQVFGVNTNDFTYYSTVTHQHIYGFLFKLLWPLLKNKKINYAVIKYPEELIGISTPFVLISSPAFLKRIYFSSDISISNCRCVFSSGGPLSFESSQACSKIFGVTPTEVYGSTETGGIAYRKNESGEVPWQLFPKVSLVLNKSGYAVRSDYFDEDEFTLSDHLKEVGSREFILLGRKDRIVKIEEKRVSLDSIESKINRLPEVAHSKVIAIEVQNRLKLAAAIVLSDLGRKKLLSDGKKGLKYLITENLKKYFEAVTLPKYYRFIDRFEENLNGKITNEYIKGLFDV